FFGVSSDFGTRWIYAGAAFYIPFAQWQRWDPNPAYANDGQFPGAHAGVQRFHAIETAMYSMHWTGTIAFNIPRTGLRIGISGTAIRTQYQAVRAFNQDGTDDVVAGTPQDFVLKEGR